MVFRGGTSKGPVFLKTDLPEDRISRDRLLLRLMGSPDARQIDGIGGGDSLSSKVVIVSPSRRQDANVDYLLCQVHLTQNIVETTLNCGNMLSVVAPFAIEKRLVKANNPHTQIRIYNENTSILMTATVQTPNYEITYEGDAVIDGVPGAAAPIKLSFLDALGSKTGKLLPTGNIVDNFDGIFTTCVDVAVPMVIINAKAMGKTGYESKTELDNDKKFLARLENVRCLAAIKMGLGDASKSISPKICLVAPARKKGAITSRYFTPFDCHDAHAVSGGLCLAAACLIEGSVAYQVSNLILLNQTNFEQEVIIEHPSGTITTSIQVEKSSGNINFPLASFIRTARPLFEGNVLVPSSFLQLSRNIKYK